MNRDICYDLSILEQYRKALDEAVKIATANNVPPIRGNTLIFSVIGESQATKQLQGVVQQVEDSSPVFT